MLSTAYDRNQSGADALEMAGHELENSPSFFLGSVMTPRAEPLEPQIVKLTVKTVGDKTAGSSPALPI